MYVPILVNKGCPYPCIYCPYPIGFGKKSIFRSPKEIVDEIEYLYNEHKIKGFLLRGASFALNLKHAEKICDEIIRRKLEIAWFCELRVNEVTKDLLKKMKKSGCKRIHYGVETGDPELLKIAKPGVTQETIKRAFRLAREIGMWVQAHMVLGWPDEDLKTLENTYKLILELNPDSINWNFMTPYPGTKIREIARKDSLILTNDWSYYTSHTVVMRSKNLDARQLYMAKRRIIRGLAKQKMRKLISQLNLYDLKQLRSLLNKTKDLVSRIIFPQNY